DARLEDDDVRVDLAAREDEVDPPLEPLLAAAGEGDLHGLADLDLRDVGLVDVRLDHELGDVGNDGDRRPARGGGDAAGDDLALFDQLLQHDPGDRRADLGVG